MSAAAVVSGIVTAVENASAAVSPQAGEILTIFKGLYAMIGSAIEDIEARMAAADAQQGVGLVAQEDSDAAGIKARLDASKPPVAVFASIQPGPTLSTAPVVAPVAGVPVTASAPVTVIPTSSIVSGAPAPLT